MIELYPHQRKAVDELKNGSILWGDVGTGKSLTAVAYYMEKEAPKDVIVITTAKKRDSLDWDEEFARGGISKHVGSSVGGLLTVDSWNNIGSYVGRTDCFFIFDEQRVVGSGEWTKHFLRITKQNHWLLLSATPGDTWLDYVPVFIANGFYKNKTEFLREHVIFNRFSKFPKVDRFVNVRALVRLRNKLLVHMPYERHTTRRLTQVPVDYESELFQKVLVERWNVFESRPIRDVAELFLVMRKVVNSSTTRVDQIRKLLGRHPKLIVFYNFNFERDALLSLRENGSVRESVKWKENEQTRTRANTESLPLQESTTGSPSTSRLSTSSSASVATPLSTTVGQGITSGSTTSTSTPGFSASGPNESKTSTFAVAEWNGHKHEPIPTTDSWIYLVQYAAGSEGWNCTETDAMVFYSLTYSYKMFAQAMGRIDRLNTPFSLLHYYLFLSNSIIDKLIWKSLSSKESFNEADALSKLVM